MTWTNCSTVGVKKKRRSSLSNSLHNKHPLHFADALQDFDKSKSGAKPEKPVATDGTAVAAGEGGDDPDAFFMYVENIAACHSNRLNFGIAANKRKS